ncbi:MAG TPA: restriction endonuclease [Terrimicrobiaceae bacterium]
MAKAGDEYQVLVGKVVQALDPGARVKVGTWIQGPDGRRDMDVEVRGMKDGKQHFVLIECKDWADPIGIEKIDALDSKRQDLAADATVIFSNSGFTEPALAKCKRVGIQAAAALVHGDARACVQIQEQYLSEGTRLSKFNVALIRPFGTTEDTMPAGWGFDDLTYLGRLLHNWVGKESMKWMEEVKQAAGRFSVEYVFRKPLEVTIRGQNFKPIGLFFTFETQRYWTYLSVAGDAAIGFYDYLEGRIVIPDGGQMVFTVTPTSEYFDKVLEGEHPNYLQMAQPHENSMRLTQWLPLLPGQDVLNLDEEIEKRLFNGLPAADPKR